MLRAGGRKNVNGTEKLPFLFDNFIICKFKIFQSFSMQLIQFYPMIIAPIKYSKVMFWNTEEHHSCTNNYAHCFSTSLNAIWIIRIIIQLSSHLELHFFDQHWCPSKLLPPLLLLFAPWKLLSSHTAFNYSAIYHIGSFSSELWANVLRSAPITHAVHSFNWSFVCLFTHSQTPSLHCSFSFCVQSVSPGVAAWQLAPSTILYLYHLGWQSQPGSEWCYWCCCCCSAKFKGLPLTTAPTTSPTCSAISNRLWFIRLKSCIHFLLFILYLYSSTAAVAFVAQLRLTIAAKEYYWSILHRQWSTNSNLLHGGISPFNH